MVAVVVVVVVIMFVVVFVVVVVVVVVLLSLLLLFELSVSSLRRLFSLCVACLLAASVYEAGPGVMPPPGMPMPGTALKVVTPGAAILIWFSMI